MTVTIEIPEERVAALKAKAAAQGLTLEDWLQKLADQGSEVEQPHKPFKSGYGLLAPKRTGEAVTWPRTLRRSKKLTTLAEGPVRTT